MPILIGSLALALWVSAFKTGLLYCHYAETGEHGRSVIWRALASALFIGLLLYVTWDY